ncbi:MAG: AI-2E family transporter [bacterium]
MTDSGHAEPGHHAGMLNLVAGLLLVVLLVVVLRALATFIQPLFVAIFVFYITQPIFNAMTQRGVPRPLAYLSLALLVLFALLLGGWLMSAQIAQLGDKFPAYAARFQYRFEQLIHWLDVRWPYGLSILQRMLADNILLSAGTLQSLIGKLLHGFAGFLSAILLVIFYLVFIFAEASTLPGRIEAAYGAGRAEGILAIGKRINASIIRYVYIKGLASLLVAVLSTAAMLAFRLDLAFLWGAAFFFGNFIPYFGSAFAFGAVFIISLLQFDSAAAVLSLAGLLMAFQISVSYYLEPKFTGRRLDLSPLVVMISLGFWGWLWGMTGLLLSIPIMVTLKLGLENIPATRGIALLMSTEAVAGR